MKIVVNITYGGFNVPKAIEEELYKKYGYENDSLRTAPELIEWLENHNNEYKAGFGTHIVVEEIPETATDWLIEEYDGIETIFYVINGKIKRL